MLSFVQTNAVAMVLWVAAMPVLELRAAIPLAFSLGFSPVEAYCLGVVGSLLPVPLLLLGLRPLASRLRNLALFRRFIDYSYNRAKDRRLLKKYGWVGLGVFVAIPLPSTGAWTGAIFASLLGLRFWPSLLTITFGTAVAGAIVTLLTLLGTLTSS